MHSRAIVFRHVGIEPIFGHGVVRLYLFLRADVAFDSFYASQFDVFNSGGDKGFAVGENA